MSRRVCGPCGGLSGGLSLSKQIPEDLRDFCRGQAEWRPLGSRDYERENTDSSCSAAVLASANTPLKFCTMGIAGDVLVQP